MSKITIKGPEDIKKLRQAGRILASIHADLKTHVVPGATTQDIEDRARELIEQYGVEPVTLGYLPDFAPRPYPAATCVSINDVVVHGIPNEHPHVFNEGDLVSIDVVIAKDGMVVDSAHTHGVGAISDEAEGLLTVTANALKAGIKAARAGSRVRAIGTAIEASVPKGYGIIEVLSGHGLGYSLHEPPDVPNFAMKGESPELRPGMVLAIEPMITTGSKQVVLDRNDGYTVVTKDGSLSAHMEHTVLITKKGPEILTA